MAKSLRDRRLVADFRELKELELRLNRYRKKITIQELKGSPPSEYIITYYCKAYVAILDDVENADKLPIEVREKHTVTLSLPSDYPEKVPPILKVNKPVVLSPNIWWDTGLICTGYTKNNPWRPYYPIEELVMKTGNVLRLDPKYLGLANPTTVPKWLGNWKKLFDNYPSPADNDPYIA